MAFSLKKRGKSKSHIISNGNNDSKALGEVLHRSTKTKSKKHKNQQYIESKLPTPSSDIVPFVLEKNPIIYRTRCPCDAHYVKQLLENSYTITVDKLFDLIFGSNEFVRTYRQAQRFYDETATDWLLNEATNQRERTLKYKVPYESTFIGKGTIFTREKQVIFVEVPGSHYTLETEVYNEGVKFSDTFSLIIRYCLVQTSVSTTNLRVTAHIIYNKSVSGFVKPIIERNAYSASQEGLKDLNNRLTLIANFEMERRCSIENGIPVNGPSMEMIPPIIPHELLPIRQSTSNDNYTNSRSSDSDRLMHILIFLTIILFFIHMYLYTRLIRTELFLAKLG